MTGREPADLQLPDSTHRVSVFVIVLTFDAPPGVVGASIEALWQQTATPTQILVVDNHSSSPVDAASFGCSGPVPVRVLRLRENVGPAGGYAAGLREFLDSACDCVWVMDDDVLPEPHCLDHLLDDLAAHANRVVVGPKLFDAFTGRPMQNWGWIGTLMTRAAVETGGFPKVALFWGLEDQEYLRDRLPLAGYPLTRSDAGIARVHDRGDAAMAPWKTYYLVRNLVYQYLYDRRHIPVSVRLKSLAHELGEYWRMAWTSDVERWRNVGSFARGFADGLVGRLGKRMEPDRADRPWGRQQ